MAARLDYKWHLRQVMASRGMFQTTDLIGPLAGRGITLSSSQVYRLVTERPERVREQPARCRGHRGRAGLPDLPPGPRSSLQHLRVRRQRPDRHLAGNRHAGLRTVPQALGLLFMLRDRGTAEGRHAARAALRALP